MCAGLLAGGWIFVAAIFVVPFEAPGKWGMKGASVHSYAAGQGQPRGDENGGEEDVRDPLCIHVSAAQAEVALSNPVFYTGTCPQKEKNGEIICRIFTTSLLLWYFSSVRVFACAPAHGKKIK